jgi:hypothetical protein
MEGFTFNSTESYESFLKSWDQLVELEMKDKIDMFTALKINLLINKIKNVIPNFDHSWQNENLIRWQNSLRKPISVQVREKRKSSCDYYKPFRQVNN